MTITLKQPDYWLEGELSSMPGVIVEKKFTQQQGKAYGTPATSHVQRPVQAEVLVDRYGPGRGGQHALLEYLGNSRWSSSSF